MIRRISLLSILLILLGTAAPVLAADQGTGTIQGQIINGTEGSASSIADQTVTMTTFLDEAETNTITAKSDTNGKFIFSGLSTDSGYSYEFKVTYQEANYVSGQVSFSTNETTKVVPLTVYDSTSSSDSVRISAAHTIVYPREGVLEVVEYLIFANDSDLTFIGTSDAATGSRRTLKLYIPSDAKDLQSTGQLTNGPDGYFDTAGVLPGQITIAYSYSLANKSATYKLIQQMNYPVDTYNFLVEGSVQATSPQLVSSGPVQMSANSTFNVLSGQNLAKGQVLNIMLSGLGGDSGSQQMVIVVLVAVVLIVAGGFLYFLKKRRPQPVKVSSSDDDVQQTLLSEIAILDDDFEGGRIEKASYERLRAEKKALLVRLMQNSPEARSRE